MQNISDLRRAVAQRLCDVWIARVPRPRFLDEIRRAEPLDLPSVPCSGGVTRGVFSRTEKSWTMNPNKEPSSLSKIRASAACGCTAPAHVTHGRRTQVHATRWLKSRLNGSARSPAMKRTMPESTVERAFQLAPDCRTMDELRSKLMKEGCTNIDAHLQDFLFGES